MTTIESSSSSSSNVASSYNIMPSVESGLCSSSNISPSSKASGSTMAKTTTLNRRQQTAQRARTLALAKQLKTRLQYATFKVEHGWSKQSLSEVENLYYRHCKAIASSSTNGSNKSPSSLRKASVPSTPKLNSKTSGLAPSGPARTSLPGHGHDSDAFGGLMTPPASGGTFPSSLHTAERDGFQTNHSFTSGLMKRDRSPTAGLDGKAGTTTSSMKQGKSYADFWSKIGTAGTGPGTNERQ